ncbi:MAG TPA: anti-sigma factor [Burkholderiales bacterium]|nr:anti-sigma factor [Burkholderiales bacterium]
MQYRDAELRSRLAAEYVLGTLSWRARRRFEAALRQNPGLRNAVADWERRLLPLADSLPELNPPARVWHAIQTRLRHARVSRGWWDNLVLWRTAAGLAMLLLALALLLPPSQQEELPPRMVVVMEDLQNRTPAMTVSWTPDGTGEKMIQVRVIGHAEMAPDTEWELWLLPDPEKPPVSLGLISTHEFQIMRVPAELNRHLNAAWGLAMSVEPKGGSPTGLPSGPVLYMGQCVKA